MIDANIDLAKAEAIAKTIADMDNAKAGFMASNAEKNAAEETKMASKQNYIAEAVAIAKTTADMEIAQASSFMTARAVKNAAEEMKKASK